MLDGQGADEQLAGYTSFLPRRARELLLQNPKKALRSVKGREWLQLLDLLLPERVRQILRGRLNKPTAKPSWINLKGIEAKDPFHKMWFEEHVRKKAKQMLMNQNHHPIEVHLYLPKELHKKNKRLFLHKLTFLKSRCNGVMGSGRTSGHNNNGVRPDIRT